MSTARGFRRFHARCRVRIDHTSGVFLPGGKPVVIGLRADHAAQAAYGRANQEVIEGGGQGFFCRGHISAVDPRHLPTKPVRNKFLCSFRQGGGPQGEASSHDSLPRRSAGKPLYRRLDSPLDSVVKGAAPIDPGERQSHTEQFFSQRLLCPAGYAVHSRLVPVSSVLHSLLHTVAITAHTQRQEGAPAGHRAEGGVRQHLRHLRPNVNGEGANRAKVLLGLLHLLCALPACFFGNIVNFLDKRRGLLPGLPDIF